MSKVKLVFVKSFVDAPMFSDTFTQDVDVPGQFGPKDQFHLMGARVYQPENADMPGGDNNAIILDSHDFGSILGKLLTYVDATYADPEQRKAHKDLIKQTVWDWERDLRERAIQTIDSHTGQPTK